MYHHHYLIIGLYFETEQKWVQCVVQVQGVASRGGMMCQSPFPGRFIYRGASGAGASAGGPRSASLIRN